MAGMFDPNSAMPPSGLQQVATPGLAGVQQAILRQQQSRQGALGAYAAALKQQQDMMGQMVSSMQQPQQGGINTPLLQLAAGFLAPTRTGGFGESLGYAAQGYGVAAAQERREEMSRLDKLNQLRLAQVELATKLPEMQLRYGGNDVDTAVTLQKLQQQQDELDRRKALDNRWEQIYTGGDLKLTPDQITALRMQPDPEKRAEMLSKFTRGKELNTKTINDLSEAGSQLGTFDALTQSWSPEYGGRGGGLPVIGGVVGATENALGRGGYGGYEQQAQWWSDYQSQKNIVRNKLFGSALTATEKGEFDKANISPEMDPKLIEKNLARQREAARAAAAKLANAYAKQGYSREAIEDAIGYSLDDIGMPKMDTSIGRDMPGKEAPARQQGQPAAPRPKGVPPGSAWSPSRQLWRTPDGKMFDMLGRPVGG